MKEKLRFLIKLLLISIVLFAIWRPVSNGYIELLDKILRTWSSDYGLTANGRSNIYFFSLYLIPFISLVINTPGVTIRKKVAVIATGAVLSLAVDFIFVEYTIHANLPATRDVNGVQMLYTTVKLSILPMLWMLVSHTHLERFFKTKEEIKAIAYTCPICEKTQADIILHLTEVHGEESLRKKKVKRFISENPELSLAPDPLNPVVD